MNFIPHTIRIKIPHARQVSLLGDFNNWHSNAHPLIEVAPDLWERIVDLPPGKHRYAFFVIDDVATPTDGIRSRILGNGAVLWVPDNPDHSFTISAHPSLALERAVARRVAKVA